MRRILALLLFAVSLPGEAATIATGSIGTIVKGMPDCNKSFTSPTGGRVDCISQGDGFYAEAHAQADAAFGDLGAYAAAAGGLCYFGACANASSSASYDEMVYIIGGTGDGMLSVLYQTGARFGDGFAGGRITQGDLVMDLPFGNCLFSPCVLTTPFSYGVPFHMTARVSAAFAGGGVDSARIGLSIRSVTDQTGHPVTLNIVPEPATGSLFLACSLGLICLKYGRRIAGVFRDHRDFLGSRF
jgi:hypothetical protein